MTDRDPPSAGDAVSREAVLVIIEGTEGSPTTAKLMHLLAKDIRSLPPLSPAKAEAWGSDLTEDARDTLCQVAQLISGWNATGTDLWSDWDKSIHEKVVALQRRLESRPLPPTRVTEGELAEAFNEVLSTGLPRHPDDTDNEANARGAMALARTALALLGER